MTRSTNPTDHDLIACAQSAWRLEGKYPLERWEIKVTDWYTYVLAHGTPKRAKHEYHHVFLFAGNWKGGQYHYHLTGIAKASWPKSVQFRGTRFTAGSVVAYFPDGQWTAETKNVLDHQRDKRAQSTHQACCEQCHTCGSALDHIDPDLLWCETCDTYR